MQITADTGKISKNVQGDLTITVALSAKNKKNSLCFKINSKK